MLGIVLSVCVGLAMPALAAPQEVPVLTIAEVIARHEALDGQLVRVKGWVGECRQLSCHVSEEVDYQGRSLSIGGSPSFDRRAARLESRWVLIEGRVSASCFPGTRTLRDGSTEISVCTDRADQIRNPRIVAVYPSTPEGR